MKRFGLTNYDQVDSLMNYFKYIIIKSMHYEDYSGDYEMNTFARILLKVMGNTYDFLYENVPFELTSRYMAAEIEV